VIDWSTDAVALLRRRARQIGSYRKPYFRNEHLWGLGGTTWNAVARYLRARVVDEAGLFGHGTPVIRPIVSWLSPAALVAILNANVTDFIVRTFLSSLMNIHLGHIRRMPVPVLTEAQFRDLHDLGSRAIAAKAARDAGEEADLARSEREIDEYVRDLYGIDRDAELWVVR
jgi:hypothetical protein